jgi:L-fuconolactonase
MKIDAHQHFWRYDPQNPAILGVVAWVPLVSPDIADALDEVIEGGSIVGVRHVLQGEHDPDYALAPDFLHGISCVEQRNSSWVAEPSAWER